ncbi:hypothetical protein KJ909_02770, partial [Patescibacteria group bacterium]|nr:hypothetical protein [Patescibacteria group bacterium]
PTDIPVELPRSTSKPKPTDRPLPTDIPVEIPSEDSGCSVSYNKPSGCSCSNHNQCSSGWCDGGKCHADNPLVQPTVAKEPTPTKKTTEIAFDQCTAFVNKPNGCNCSFDSECVNDCVGGKCGIKPTPRVTSTNVPVYRSCNSPCKNPDFPCSGGNSCVWVGGSNKCRNSKCSNETDCDCTVEPTNAPIVSGECMTADDCDAKSGFKLLGCSGSPRSCRYQALPTATPTEVPDDFCFDNSDCSRAGLIGSCSSTHRCIYRQATATPSPIPTINPDVHCNAQLLSNLGCGKEGCKANEAAELWKRVDCVEIVRCNPSDSCNSSPTCTAGQKRCVNGQADSQSCLNGSWGVIKSCGGYGCNDMGECRQAPSPTPTWSLFAGDTSQPVNIPECRNGESLENIGSAMIPNFICITAEERDKINKQNEIIGGALLTTAAVPIVLGLLPGVVATTAVTSGPVAAAGAAMLYAQQTVAALPQGVQTVVSGVAVVSEWAGIAKGWDACQKDPNSMECASLMAGGSLGLFNDLQNRTVGVADDAARAVARKAVNPELIPAMDLYSQGDYEGAMQETRKILQENATVFPFDDFRMEDLPIERGGFQGFGQVTLNQNLSLKKQSSFSIHEGSHFLDDALGRAKSGLVLKQTEVVWDEVTGATQILNPGTIFYPSEKEKLAWAILSESKAYLTEYAMGGRSLASTVKNFNFSISSDMTLSTTEAIRLALLGH